MAIVRYGYEELDVSRRRELSQASGDARSWRGDGGVHSTSARARSRFALPPSLWRGNSAWQRTFFAFPGTVATSAVAAVPVVGSRESCSFVVATGGGGGFDSAQRWAPPSLHPSSAPAHLGKGLSAPNKTRPLLPQFSFPPCRVRHSLHLFIPSTTPRLLLPSDSYSLYNFCDQTNGSGPPLLSFPPNSSIDLAHQTFQPCLSYLSSTSRSSTIRPVLRTSTASRSPLSALSPCRRVIPGPWFRSAAVHVPVLIPRVFFRP